VVQLNIQISQGSATTDLRLGGRFYYTFFRCFFANAKVKKNIKTDSHLPELS